MNGTLEFEDAGRTYTCRVDDTPGSRLSSWWWFSVSGDGHRYAPFRAAEDDTPASVRDRVVQYYLNHLTRRSMPTEARSSWGRRPGAPAPGPAKS
jgi:hypothetical protein